MDQLPESTAPARRTVAHQQHPVSPDWPWPEREVSAVGYRLHAHGASEAAACRFLDHLALTKVRRLLAYVNGIGDTDLIYTARRAAKVAAKADSAANAERSLYGQRRGDVMTVRRPVRWPWPVTSGNDNGGHA